MASEKNMSEISKQMNLDMGKDFVPKSISDVLTELSMIHDFSLKSSKLDFHVHLLEEELRKIDAFKRELPYCMQLLQDGIETLRKESLRLREIEEGPVLVTEELLPLQSGGGGGGGGGGERERGKGEKPLHNLSDKKAWMSRVRLWTAPVQFHNGDEPFSFKSRGGAELPLKRAFGSMKMAKEEKSSVPVEEQSLSVPVEAVDLSDDKDFNHHNKKQRRCWSPQLHMQFVDALLQLGGPYEATPKQIRDLMKVEGLTNDEVKSHLQKYRLHIRKLPGSTSASPEENLDEGGSAARGGAAAADEADKSVSRD